METRERKIITSFATEFMVLLNAPRPRVYSPSGRLALGKACEHVWTPGEFLLPHDILVAIAQIYLWHIENALKKSCFLTMTSWAMCSSGDCWAPRFACRLGEIPAHSGPSANESRVPSRVVRGCCFAPENEASRTTRAVTAGGFASLAFTASIFLWGRLVLWLCPCGFSPQAPRGAFLRHQWKQEVMKQVRLASALSYFFLFVIPH